MFQNTPDIPCLLRCISLVEACSIWRLNCVQVHCAEWHIFVHFFCQSTSVFEKNSSDGYTTVCGCAVNLNAWTLCELGDQNVAILERKRMQDFILLSLWMSHELWKYYKQLTQVELKPLFKHDCMHEFWRICKGKKIEMSNGWHYWLGHLLNVIESSLCLYVLSLYIDPCCMTMYLLTVLSLICSMRLNCFYAVCKAF